MANARQSTADFKGDHLSALMFGVVGDGVFDDTAGLQAAVTAAAGRTLLIPRPSNYYKVSGSISLPSNITVLGDAATRIVQTAFRTPVFSINTQSEVTIRSMAIEGPGASDWNSAGNTTARLIDIVNGVNIRLEDLKLSKYGHSGIAFQSTKGLFVHQCVIVGLDNTVIHNADNYNFGIVSLGTGIGYGPVTITACDFSQGVTGINSQDDTNDWLVSGCSFHDNCGQHGIYINPGRRGAVIVGNRFSNLQLDGVKMTKTTGNAEDCEGAVVAGNRFTICGNACINLGIASGTKVLRNVTVVGNAGEWADLGLSVVTPGPPVLCEKFVIADNNFSHIGNYGLRLSNVTGKVTGNHIHDVGGSGIYAYPGDQTQYTLYISDNLVTGAGNGQAYGGAGVIATKLGWYLAYGMYVLQGNVVLIDAGAAYAAIYDHATLTWAGGNFVDISKSNSYVSSTVASAISQSADGRFLIGDPTGGPAQASAILELRSTTQGFLVPNMTTAQRDAMPAKTAGLNIFNGSLARPQFWDGGAWRQYATTQEPAQYAPYTAGTTVPTIAAFGPLVVMMIANGSPTTITNFTASQNGQVLILLFADANTTIARGGTITLDGGVNFVSANFRTLMLAYSGGIWRQVGKASING